MKGANKILKRRGKKRKRKRNRERKEKYFEREKKEERKVGEKKETNVQKKRKERGNKKEGEAKIRIRACFASVQAIGSACGILTIRKIQMPCVVLLPRYLRWRQLFLDT